MTWLVTGCAGFIGSHVIEELLLLDQKVVGIDNFSTGSFENLNEVKTKVGEKAWKNFLFLRGDVSDIDFCLQAFSGQNIDYVLHLAAMGSVPRSFDNPLATHLANVNGQFNMLMVSAKFNVKKYVFSSSSSVYGNHLPLPFKEEYTPLPISPYASSKLIGEIYANTFRENFELNLISLRYFNVFGPRQNYQNSYSQVIPKWISSMISNTPIYIFGDGMITRDFTYVKNIVQANILAALSTSSCHCCHKIYNIATGKSISLNALFSTLKELLASQIDNADNLFPIHMSPRKGDILHTLADTSKAQRELHYFPSFGFEHGILETIRWYVEKYKK